MEDESARLGLVDRVMFLGSRRDATVLMGAADAVVHPTLQEAFSQVMAEALWMGKPLVISAVSGATDVIRDGINGFLVRRGTSRPSQKPSVLIKNPGLGPRLGEAGRRLAQDEFPITKVISRYEKCYARAMAGRPTSA